MPDLKDFFAALHAPVAPHTEEARVDLDSAGTESERVAFRWARPVRILGLYASLVITGTGQTDPTLDDILCLLDVHDETLYTRRSKVPGGGVTGQQYVTLSSLVVAVPRLLNIEILTDAPELGMRFRWEDGVSYNDTRIKVACFWDYLDSLRSEN